MDGRKRKKGSRGKQKGASFERATCQRLSLWVSDFVREDVFWRSAMSGGRATVMRAAGKSNDAQSGDISATHALGYPLLELFSIECKFYADLNLALLAHSTRGPMSNFWEQTCRDADASHKLPMLIAKQNNVDTLVCLDRRGVAKFERTDLPEKCLFTIPVLNLHAFGFRDLLTTNYAQTGIPPRRGGRNPAG